MNIKQKAFNYYSKNGGTYNKQMFDKAFDLAYMMRLWNMGALKKLLE